MIEPEVAGEIGKNTVYYNYNAIINDNEKPIITQLHFVFDGWLGDELLEVTPCFLVSERLKNEMEMAKFSGCIFEEIEISYSNEFVELYSDREVPNFYRLIPQKNIVVENECYSCKDMDDFMISTKSYLIISEKVKDFLNSMNVDENADYTILRVQ
jgi:hypothetical protein